MPGPQFSNRRPDFYAAERDGYIASSQYLQSDPKYANMELRQHGALNDKINVCIPKSTPNYHYKIIRYIEMKHT